MADIASQLDGFTRDSQNLEAVRSESQKNINALAGRLEKSVNDMARLVFATDKQFEKAVNAQATQAQQTGQELNFRRGAQTFQVGQIDAKAAIADRELSSSEEAKLQDLQEAVASIYANAKVVVGSLNREIYLAEQFKSIAEASVASTAKQVESLTKAANSGDANAANQIREVMQSSSALQQRSSSLASAVAAIKTTRTEATKLMVTAESSLNFLKQINNRSDIETMLLAAAGGFGIVTAVAALSGAMSAAGILALPALIAFGAARIIALIRGSNQGG